MLNAKAGEKVTLNGANSYDPNGSQITYLWSLLAIPAGVGIPVITNPNSSHPTFVSDEAGQYVVSLVVSDGSLKSDTSITTIKVTAQNFETNLAPVANAGSKISAPIGEVTLDGTASFDADGNRLTYKWYLVSKPDGSKADLTSKVAAKPNSSGHCEIAPPEPALYSESLLAP